MRPTRHRACHSGVLSSPLYQCSKDIVRQAIRQDQGKRFAVLTEGLPNRELLRHWCKGLCVRSVRPALQPAWEDRLSAGRSQPWVFSDFDWDESDLFPSSFLICREPQTTGSSFDASRRYPWQSSERRHPRTGCFGLLFPRQGEALSRHHPSCISIGGDHL